MKTKTLCIAEWQDFDAGDIEKVLENEGEYPKSTLKAREIFEEFVEFAQGKDNDKFLKFRGSKALKAQNHVGLIQTKSGFCLEILPKICDTKEPKCECKNKNHIDKEKLQKNIESFCENFKSEASGDVKCHTCGHNKDSVHISKEVLLNCLKTLKDTPFRHIDTANIKTMNVPLLEIFAMSFLNECEKLIKRGIRKDYVNIEENRHFLKGKLLFNENLKHNFAHKERFYTAFDEFSPNIAPNRLIVSTLHFIKKQNFSQKTEDKLNQLLFIFEEIPPSYNIKADFDKCHQSRYFNAYKLILQWCEVFLDHRSFAPYSGDSINFTLLFPMEKLFESFVAFHLKKNAREQGYGVKTQDKRKYLMRDNEGKNLFQLKPDMVLYYPNNPRKITIADTKWKILSSKNDRKKYESDKRKCGVSESDLYQMFAYASKYKAKEVILIYPLCERTKDLKNEWDSNKKWTFKANDIRLELAFFPLFALTKHPKSQIQSKTHAG